MKTRISLDLHRHGTLNDSIVRMITAHNEGLKDVTEPLIRMRYHCYEAEWNRISPEFKMIGNGAILDIYENDQLTLTLRWNVIPEVNDTELNLISQELLR